MIQKIHIKSNKNEETEGEDDKNNAGAISYISKGSRGMSRLLKQACKEANEGNNSLKEQMRHKGKLLRGLLQIDCFKVCYN